MNLRLNGGTARVNVLSIKPFRRLWIAMSLSSLGDWLSLLALSQLALYLGGGKHSTTAAAAVSGVWLSSLLPALLLGPLAGAMADRLDRRYNMIVFDVIRAALYLSIPLDLAVGFADKLTWMYAVQFLASCASLFWTPAKDASVPNLVPADRLEQANQYSLVTTFGTALPAGVIFAALAGISHLLSLAVPYFQGELGAVVLALYFNVGTFVVSAITVYILREIPKRGASAHISSPSVAKAIWQGWRFIGRDKVVRGVIIGMIGAFAAGGVVLGIGPTYIEKTLQGGSGGYGVVFAAVFLGLAAGMFAGMRVLAGFSRRRLFGVSIVGAGAVLALIGLIPSLVAVVLLVVLLGAFAGSAYVTGYTIVGLEVDDDTRGRVFAFLQSGIRVIMLTVVVIAPLLSGGLDALVHSTTGASGISFSRVHYADLGSNLVLLLSASMAIWLGVVSYRHLDDRRGIPLREDLLAAVRGEPFTPLPVYATAEAQGSRGLLIAVEGGEGAGKSTQARLLAIWLREQGYDVVATHEPGATKAGMRLRALLLDTALTGMSARAETLMYAADRAEHVAAVIAPALARGAVVVTDRYVDSSIAYQGRGREQPVRDIAMLNQWATSGLAADLTVVLDLPPAVGLARRARSADRLEAEPLEFHDRVREGFLALASATPSRYMLLDATNTPEWISQQIQARVRGLLPDPVPPATEASTGSFPAILERPAT